MDSYLNEVTGRLVAADTVSSRPNLALVEWMADALEASGFRTALQPSGEGGAAKANLVAWAGPPEPDGLVLSGHVDVVPFEDQPGWTRDPLRFVLDGARGYGRGSSDMKGFLALCLEAARALETDSLERPLVFVFTSDEEVGCLGAARLAPALSGLVGELPLPRLAWIGEPTSWRIFPTHKGVVAFQVEVRGEGGHSGVPEAGVNAIAVAARAIEAIGHLQAELRSAPPSRAAADYPDSPHTTLNVATVSGGSASNMIAERCHFGVSYRPLPDGDPLAAYRQIAERLARLEVCDYGGGALRAEIRVGEPLVVPGLRSVRGTPLEAALAAALGTPAGGGAPFCTDAGHLASAGLESLICGPGDLDQAHQPDESIRLDALERGRTVVRQVLAGLLAARFVG